MTLRIAHVEPGPDLSRFVGIAFGVSAQIAFVITVCLLFIFLRDGRLGSGGNWATIDLLLSVQFAAAHSILLLPSVKRRMTRIVPAEFYGCLFCAATCAGLWPVFAFWRGSSANLWNATGPARLVAWGGFYVSWVSLFLSLRSTGIGYQSGWTPWAYWLRRQSLPLREFKERGAYRWLRHPVYMSFLGLIWFTPRMSADHALLTSVWTVYVFIGSVLKDRRLCYYLGDAYREYASRVPGYPGMLFGPLGKWRRETASSHHGHINRASDVRRAA